MKNKTKQIIAVVSSCILIVIAVMILIAAYFVPKWGGIDTINENNTTQYVETVEYSEKTKDGYSIKLVGYDCRLTVYSYLLSEDEDLTKLSYGETVTFRIQFGDINPFVTSGIENIAVKSLQVGDREIVPLSLSNEIYIKTLKRNKIISTIISSVIIVVAILLSVLVFYKTTRKKQTGSDNSTL